MEMINRRKDILTEAFYLTDGGLETSLIFHQGIELNHFAAFELVNNIEGRKALESYYQPYLELAGRYQYDFILETPTWRANPDWAYRLGYSTGELVAVNKNAVQLVRAFAERYGTEIRQILISGNIGPRGDGYRAEDMMTVEEAESYHHGQIMSFALADVDLVTAFTLNYVSEAAGIVKAAARFNIPVAISFTVETDGKLPCGESLGRAIEKTDSLSNGYASHYMINCAHPDHFSGILGTDGDWKSRIRGVRANASTKSHAELDEAETLDAGDRCHLATNYVALRQLLPDLKVVGGCCGTDHSHVEEICQRFGNRVL